MNREQEIRFNFLDEAQNYFDNIESILLKFTEQETTQEDLDLALRAAHSVKGGAGMMGFSPLSMVAHRLEDFFKILRLRYHSTKIETEVQTLLLKGVDNLREIASLHRQGTTIDELSLKTKVLPVFDQLKTHLGELDQNDENQLFNQIEDSNSELIMFEDQVEVILDDFERQLETFPPDALSDILFVTAEQLMVFSQLANLDSFTELCQSVQSQAQTANLEDIKSLAQDSLDIWRRSHALVLRGSLEKLPSQLTSNQPDINLDQEDTISFPFMDEINTEDEFPEFPEPEWENEDSFEFNEIDSLDLDLSEVQSQLTDIDEESLETLTSELESISELNLENPEDLNPQDLHTNILSISENDKVTTSSSDKSSSFQEINRTVRVPVTQLYQFNKLLGKLTLERNKVNLQLQQLHNVASLMRKRMYQLEKSNTKLKSWYDKASIEGVLNVEAETKSASLSTKKSSPKTISFSSSNQIDLSEFDTLEMDRYTDLHLISQEQMESIVQLEEVTNDIETGLQDITSVMDDLNRTTRSLQTNASRTQMVPFGDVVKMFPRVARDLSVQFGKKVSLKIEGEDTLIDRSILESLNAPLMHLFRNAFDHGIEDQQTRMKLGKVLEGTINIQASNRGTQTVITISDDGAGIPLGKIKTRLQKRGMSAEKIKSLSETEILNYIFEPGFSTTEKVTELSGRGVGMDVVRTNLQEIRGDIQVETKANYGTKFTLSVPFTLSVLRVMLLERAGIVFALSVDTIKEMVRLTPEEIAKIKSSHQLMWEKSVIPVMEIEKNLIFNRPNQPFLVEGMPVINKPTALVVGEKDGEGGLLIDRVWGEQEVTIHSIDSPLPLPYGFLSSIVLGDGRVVPLVDPVQILEACLEDYGVKDDKGIVVASKDITVATSQEQLNRILIVDDSINVRNYLALTLEKAGYDVEQAKDGREAVNKLFAGISVGAVICDIEMPRLDGYGVLEEVKAKPEFKRLPIAMLTSRSNEKHRKIAMNLGASAYFSKPYNEQELLQTLKDLISLK